MILRALRRFFSDMFFFRNFLFVDITGCESGFCSRSDFSYIQT